MSPRRASAAQVVAAVAALADRPSAAATRFVGIDGRAGSGKSTLARFVAARVAGAVVIAADDFAGPHVPEWDWPRFRQQVVVPLQAGRRARYQRWEWQHAEPAGWCSVAPGGVVLVEGVSSTRSELEVPWALRVWVEAPRELRLRRALARDGAALLGQWRDVWMPSEEAYVARDNPVQRADLIVNGAEQLPLSVGHATIPV
jgi:uridine kinase